MIGLEDNPYRDPLTSPERRANYEYHLALDCTLPLLSGWGIEVDGINVLDIGCGSGGLCIAMTKEGANCMGIDLNYQRIFEARKMANERSVEVRFLKANILDLADLGERFDLIVMLEVLEHLLNISNVEKLLRWCKEHLNGSGRIYLSFPPWYGPFAGHQAGWPRIRFIPWFHLLPEFVKKTIAPRNADRYSAFSQELNKLTITDFDKILSKTGFRVFRRDLYHLRPEYHWRYGTPIIRSPRLLGNLEALREITTTGVFYLIGLT
jgi:2-polyprenyl-3-methyl-5-hydroxy-6-metoxy-1,4-benzoquinol methylase